jgi:hypothetical protein
MQGEEVIRRVALAAIVAAALLGAAVAVAAGPSETFKVGNLDVKIEGGITPTKLPKGEKAPIVLNVGGSIKTVDGSHPPALKTLKLEFDKAGELNTKGLPTCTVGKLLSTLTAQAKKLCGTALVGTGTVTAEIALPEQAPFSASGPLLIFNGAPKGGKQVLIFHVHANVPAPTTFVTTAVISKTPGRFGTTADVTIPTIVSGQGSLTGFKAKLGKTWTYKGQKESLLLASCPTGSLRARGEFLFADGTKGSGEVVRACTPSTADALVAKASAIVAEVSRDEYKEAVEPICMSNTKANERILAGVRKEVQTGKLKTAAAKFAKASTELKRTLKELEAVPQPAADAARLGKWFALVEEEAELFATAGKKLKSGDKAGAEHIVTKLTQNANKANLEVLPFGFRYCRLEPSKFT